VTKMTHRNKGCKCSDCSALHAKCGIINVLSRMSNGGQSN